MKRIVLAGIVAVLLMAISAGASSNVAYANSSSNGTSTALTSTWTEYSNVSIAPAATGNTTVSISVVARINYSQAILYGRLKRNGVVFETFNLSQSTYPGSMTFSSSQVEASGTQYYSFEAYCTSGRLCTIMNRTFNVLYTNPDITALTLNQINASAGIDGLRANDTTHDTKLDNVNTTKANKSDIGEFNGGTLAAARLDNNQRDSYINVYFDNGANNIITGAQPLNITVPGGDIVEARVLCNNCPSGSGVFNISIRKSTYAGFPPTAGIGYVNMSGAIKAQDTTLTGWTTAVTAGDVLSFYINAVADVRAATLTLIIRRT